MTIATTPIEKLDAIREWVDTGIARTLDQAGGTFLLGIESASILDALDEIREVLSHQPTYLTEDELQQVVKNERLVSENGAHYRVLSSPGDRNHPQLMMNHSLYTDVIHWVLPRFFRDRRGR